MMEKLDAHMHVWKIARGDYDWLTPELGAIYRDFAIQNSCFQSPIQTAG